MSQASERTRRQALAAGLAGASLAALPEVGCATRPKEDGGPGATSTSRMPAIYLPHGGGPWPFVDLGMPKAELDDLAKYLRDVRAVPKSPPKALLVVSAHWEEKVPTVMTAERPPMLYDYYGFPPESYRVTWPAPGDPALAARVRDLLGAAGFASAEDPARGFDHGTFVPLKLAWPDADVPTVQLSLKEGLDPREHLAIGRALAPLRDEGVFVIGSGSSFHNMRGFRDRRLVPQAEEFDRWLRETIEQGAEARDRRLADWANAPSARAAHPREEHLLPLMVVAGAAGSDRGRTAYRGAMMGMALSGHHFG
jgi:aromatic ring-opening dioxygenase catalytic subunit (LigB family)